MNKTREAECRKKAKDLVSKMTLTEKVYQLRHTAPAIPRLGLGAYNYWNEALHGVARAGEATVFPQAIGMAAAFDEELIGLVADVISTEGRAKFNVQNKYGDNGIYKGLTFWAPNINIFRDPRWGRGHETYGEDPYLTSRLGVSFVNGIQGNDENYMKAAACAKHFAVHSGPESIRHSFNAECSKQDLRETYLPAFKALVTEAKVEAVMGAYNRTNGEACCASKTLLKDILRDEWGFEGHVTSDCWAIRDINEGHGITSSPSESVGLAMTNGCDINCGNLYEYLLQAVGMGYTTEERIDEALTNVLTTRFKLGILDTDDNGNIIPYSMENSDDPYASIDYSHVDSFTSKEINLKIAEESIVLLKNEGNLLPIDKNEITKIGVIGPNADSRKALVGNYEGTSSEYVTVLEGIRREVENSGTRVFASVGCDLYRPKVEPLGEQSDRLAEVKAVCDVSDVIIAVMGLDASLEGEEGDTGNAYGSGDKPNLLLPGLQQEVLDTIAASGKPAVLVVLSGSALALDKASSEFKAVIQGWYPGAQGGNAIAHVLFGRKNPEGHLPVTFYSEKNTLPEFTDYAMKGRTYRYMTEEPLYPFGFGLSYTDFDEKISDVSVNGSAVHFKAEEGISDGKVTECSDAVAFKQGYKLDITVKVSNKGNKAGTATVQAYVESGISGAPLRQLKGLKKVSLEAGEEKDVIISLDENAFGLFDENGEWKLNSGNYNVFIGNAQPDKRSAELTGKKCEKISVKI
ncbi:MAG: glycoside hydrolase family 3 C-terminal domain-containing protein [Lachnospiraceae bacterium]|nr:glycoside hydrolase family 3 C-terminal domain-containing protein [Lachnospiraceae bacterium]